MAWNVAVLSQIHQSQWDLSQRPFQKAHCHFAAEAWMGRCTVFVTVTTFAENSIGTCKCNPTKEAENELSNISNPECFVTSGNLHTIATSHHRGPSDCMLCFIFRRKNTNNEQSFQTLHFCLRTQDKHAFATPTNINEVLASLAEAMPLFRQWMPSKKKASVNDVANKKKFTEKHVQNSGTELLHTQPRTWACALQVAILLLCHFRKCHQLHIQLVTNQQITSLAHLKQQQKFNERCCC